MYIIDYLYIASWPAILSYLRNTYEENLAGHFRNVRAKPPFFTIHNISFGHAILENENCPSTGFRCKYIFSRFNTIILNIHKVALTLKTRQQIVRL